MKSPFAQTVASLLIVFVAASLARADGPRADRPQPPAAPEISLGELEPTPDMWIYTQEVRRADDPQTILRRRAEQQTAERKYRIAMRKSLGVSASRPARSPMPWWASELHTDKTWHYRPLQVIELSENRHLIIRR